LIVTHRNDSQILLTLKVECEILSSPVFWVQVNFGWHGRHENKLKKLKVLTLRIFFNSEAIHFLLYT